MMPYVPQLLEELGLTDDLVRRPSQTGVYFDGRLWKLATPLDLLRFTALSLVDRIRLGFLVFQVRRIKDWKTIEGLAIREWLEPLCGKAVYQAVWEPLITGKFSVHAECVSAAWMWKEDPLAGRVPETTRGMKNCFTSGADSDRLAKPWPPPSVNPGAKCVSAQK